MYDLHYYIAYVYNTLIRGTDEEINFIKLLSLKIFKILC